MEYNSYKNIKYYKECAALVEGMGYKLVDLKIVPAKSITKISTKISTKNFTKLFANGIFRRNYSIF